MELNFHGFFYFPFATLLAIIIFIPNFTKLKKTIALINRLNTIDFESFVLSNFKIDYEFKTIFN
jgi:hypothetical protein